MVQEVQTWIGITNETTLETIEAIGTSSFKIKEWRQTTARYLSECSWRADVDRTYSSGGSRDSGLIKWVVTLNDSVWKAEFMQVNGGIRIPTAWTYQLTFNWQAGGTNFDSTLYLRNWPNPTDKVIYTFAAIWTYKSIDDSFIVDLGKFDIITAWATFYYNGSASGAWLADRLTTITIKQL